MKLLKKIFTAVLIMMILIIAAFKFSYQNTSTRRPKNNYKEKIEQVKSSFDKDGDGVDDQQDILNSALAYIQTKPKYASRYYWSGYPDDGYGVCTDVVAAAMKGAGYDLRELVSHDIKENPGEYNIEAPDNNIDYRRVRNLQVFFNNNAKSLSTNIFDIDDWQGGDIVIFKKHIGIVSDRRNKRGVPYLIHHSGKWQRTYEQNYLENRQENIIGHYRWSGKTFDN